MMGGGGRRMNAVIMVHELVVLPLGQGTVGSRLSEATAR